LHGKVGALKKHKSPFWPIRGGGLRNQMWGQRANSKWEKGQEGGRKAIFWADSGREIAEEAHVGLEIRGWGGERTKGK